MRPSRAEPVAISIHGSCRDASPGAKGRRSRNTLGHKAGRHATKTPRGSGKKCRWPCKASEPCGKQGCRCRGLVGSGCPLGACVAERGSRPPWPSGSGKGFGARVSGGVVSRRRQRIRASLAGDCRRDRGHVASPFLTAGRRGTASVQSHGATAQHVCALPCSDQLANLTRPRPNIFHIGACTCTSVRGGRQRQRPARRAVFCSGTPIITCSLKFAPIGPATHNRGDCESY